MVLRLLVLCCLFAGLCGVSGAQVSSPKSAAEVPAQIVKAGELRDNHGVNEYWYHLWSGIQLEDDDRMMSVAAVRQQWLLPEEDVGQPVSALAAYTAPVPDRWRGVSATYGESLVRNYAALFIAAKNLGIDAGAVLKQTRTGARLMTNFLPLVDEDAEKFADDLEICAKRVANDLFDAKSPVRLVSAPDAYRYVLPLPKSMMKSECKPHRWRQREFAVFVYAARGVGIDGITLMSVLDRNPPKALSGDFIECYARLPFKALSNHQFVEAMELVGVVSVNRGTTP